MRTALTCLAWLCAAGVGYPQTPPYLATVVADNVSLRSGAGNSMEETGSLARGEFVVVLNDEGSQWVAVEPPRGQVSWVRTAKLQELDGGDGKPTPRNAVVCADPSAEVMMGRPGLASPLPVSKDKLPEGTVVLVIGPAYLDTSAGRTSWTPIQPAKGERRYLPRSAIQVTRGEATPAFDVKSPPIPKLPPPGDPPEMTPVSGSSRPPAAALPAPPAATPAARAKPADWPNDPQWDRAEEANRKQEYDRAERLYVQLATDQNRPGGDVELANLCYARVHDVTEKRQAAGRSPRPAGKPVSRGDSDTASRSASGEPRWTFAGTIRETGFDRGRPKYSFRAAETGKVVAYLEAGPGVDLGRWREAEVKLYAAARADSDPGNPPTWTVSRVDRAGSRRD